ncbi:DUF4345 domain-containing protein [Sulfitobacter sp. JB4-11]|uniref:DUF4345 domain-containing protein n=1 Tax=Sulfitobacter rhodophyticola TaxID=3238304 RepID=UPI003514072C
MTFTFFQKLTLGIAGASALAVGLSILAVPQAFYASYGIALGGDVNLLSELRAPAAGLCALGAVMLIGIWHDRWRETSIVAAFTVFLAFPAGRIIGLIVDGIPSGSVMGALILELVIAALCLAAFGRRPRTVRDDRCNPQSARV